MKHAIKIVISILLSNALPAESVCDFCKENFMKYASFGPHPSKDGFFVIEGTTCNQIYLGSTKNSTLCTDIKKNYKVCCSEVPQTPTHAPSPQQPSSLPLGVNKICQLCSNGKEPRNKNTVIYSNYINGSKSCIQLHNMGLTRNIQDIVCYPLQLYAKIPCGCDEKNTTSNTTSNICKA